MPCSHHLRADVVIFSRTILSSASLYKALFCTLGFHSRRFLQHTQRGDILFNRTVFSDTQQIQRKCCSRSTGNKPVSTVLAHTVAKQHCLAGKEAAARPAYCCTPSTHQSRWHVYCCATVNACSLLL